ncbi:hypothetical protein ACIBPB_05175 [Micromonospora sp. NPDC049836]|uniref:hypothetical protein n=1 Tax=Micromonospora sp. NPDC049836 TaxID=3364274 RepID=UPI0037B7ACDD
MTVITPVRARLVDGRLQVYDLADPAVTGRLSPAAEFDLGGADGRIEGWAVTRDLRRLVYATTDDVRCVDPDGRPLWRLDFGPRPEQRIVNARVSCTFSADERLLWVYRPDAMAMRDKLDRWLVLDAATGALRAEAELLSVGHGGEHFVEPDGEHMLLDVGEGQDGSRVFRGRLTETGIELRDDLWDDDRTVIGFAPDGRQVMTVHHEQEDAAFHTWPDGAVTARVPLAAFGHEWGDAVVEWAGGYLDGDTAVVAVAGEDEETEEEWYRHHLVDVHTGQLRGAFPAAQTRHAYDLEPLGDGTWLRTDDDGRLWRHRYDGA